MYENTKISSKINHIKKCSLQNVRNLRYFVHDSMYHVIRQWYVVTGVMDHGKFWLQNFVKEVTGFCQVYNKPLLESMLTYIKETCMEVTIYQ